jgi:hypothetical protein
MSSAGKNAAKAQRQRTPIDLLIVGGNCVAEKPTKGFALEIPARLRFP